MSFAKVNLDKASLLKRSIELEEGELTSDGVLSVDTGSRTGRSPKDRFIVKDAKTANVVAWGKNSQPIEKNIFDNLWARAEQAISAKEHFVNYLYVGSDPSCSLAVKVMVEKAWHAVFALNMFIARENSGPQDFEGCWQLLNVPSLSLDGAADGVNSDGAVLLDFYNKKVLICGILYSGEIKKAMFTALNYYLPEADILPMHCAANVGDDGSSALFFGLSGTGKTTLSADVSRKLVGDDEHGWSKEKVFNFEGGCYAKCIHLSQANEPVIWQAIQPGAILENVVLDANKQPDFSNSSKTENTRASYPLSFVDNIEKSSQAKPPKAVVFLACDLYGVLPAVSLLSADQAAYYFLSGYTALVGSTEGEAAEIKPTFSTCFGAAFFPRNPLDYAALLQKRLLETNAKVYLVNTGWHGGSYSEGGSRYSIDFTRSIVNAAINNSFSASDCDLLPGFNLLYPRKLTGVNSGLLNPRDKWSDLSAYEQSATQVDSRVQS